MKAYLEPEEVTLMEKVASYLRDRLLIRLLFRLGCRISEALGIMLGDIDFNHGTVTIEHLKRRVKLPCGLLMVLEVEWAAWVKHVGLSLVLSWS